MAGDINSLNLLVLLLIWMLNSVTDLLNTQATLERSHLTDSDIIRPHQNTPSITDVLLNLPKDPQVKYFRLF